MIANILTNLIGVLVFLFIFWKKLREDYTSETIFSLAALIFAGMIISSIVSFNFFPEWHVLLLLHNCTVMELIYI